MNKESSPENEGTRPPSETEEMQVRSKRSGLSRTHTSTWGNCHGPHQIIWDCRMANPNKSKRHPILSGIHQLLQKVHRRLLEHCHPLINLTKKNQEWRWSTTCQKAFDQLKGEFSKQSVLSLPDLNKPFAIATDTSKDASGGIFLQADSNGEWHPCSYLSQSFSPTKRNYDIYDRELLTVIQGLKTWKHYLQGSPFPVKVFTNLLYFKEPHKLNRRQARWMLDISNYDLKLIHVPGKELAGPDALSRRPDLIPKENNDNKQITLLP